MIDPIQDAHDKGLISFGDWLDRAIRQHPEKITLKLAHSILIAPKKTDYWDLYVFLKGKNN